MRAATGSSCEDDAAKSDMNAYLLSAVKAFRRHLQYRAAHMVNNAASAIFGFMYIAIWQAATGGHPAADAYGGATMAHWVAFNQVMLWACVFLTRGLGIPEAVRTGAIALELLRPLDFHLYVLSRELGSVGYNLLFRGLPLAVVFGIVVGVHTPSRAATYLWLLCAVALSIYIGLCLQYLIGISAVWTMQIRAANHLFFTLHTAFSGFLVPIDLLPRPFDTVARLLPFAALHYDPARIYLEMAGAEALAWPALWAAVLTLACRGLTIAARRRLEVQGG